MGDSAALDQCFIGKRALAELRSAKDKNGIRYFTDICYVALVVIAALGFVVTYAAYAVVVAYPVAGAYAVVAACPVAAACYFCCNCCVGYAFVVPYPFAVADTVGVDVVVVPAYPFDTANAVITCAVVAYSVVAHAVAYAVVVPYPVAGCLRCCCIGPLYCFYLCCSLHCC